MNTSNLDCDWNAVISMIKNSACTGCNRNADARGEDFKVLIPRTSTSNVKYVLISQDPAFFYVNTGPGGLRCRNGDEIRNRFVEFCKYGDQNATSTRSDILYDLDGRLIRRKVTIFARKILGLEAEGFDPVSDSVYWTHSLKCPPLASDRDYRKDIKGARGHCLNHLRMELDGIKSKRFCVVAIGRRALSMCAEILKLPTDGKGIVNYEVSQVTKRKSVWNPVIDKGREINAYTFVHPSVRNKYECIRELDDREHGIMKDLYP